MNRVQYIKECVLAMHQSQSDPASDNSTYLGFSRDRSGLRQATLEIMESIALVAIDECKHSSTCSRRQDISCLPSREECTKLGRYTSLQGRSDRVIALAEQRNQNGLRVRTLLSILIKQYRAFLYTFVMPNKRMADSHEKI